MNERQRFPPERPWWLLPLGRIPAAWWGGICALMVGIDYFTGPNIDFPVAYVLPVILAAWYSGRAPAIMVAIVMPLIHLAFVFEPLRHQQSLTEIVTTTTFRGIAIIFIAMWFARLSAHEREMSHRVEVLEGLLPICAFCKSIRNDTGDWERLETYITERSEAVFSHGFCPACVKIHYPEISDEAQPTAPR